MIKTKYRFIVLICCISLSLILGISSQSEAENSEDEFEEVLIHLSHEAEIDSKAPREKVIDSLQQAAGNSQASLLDFLENKQEKNYVGEIKSYYVANVIYAELTPGLFERVEDRSDVEQVYPNEELSFNLPTPQGAVSAHGIDFPWNLEHIKADEVWNKYDIEGEGVVIGIIDTGVDWEHPALKKSWRGYEAKEVDYNWFDPINEASMPNDQHGHGSHVAGIAVGHDEDAGIKIGAAPGAQWIAARGLSDYGSGYLEDLIAAGEFMLAPTDLEGDNPDPDKAPDIIINSWGIENVDGEWYNEMIENWRKADILPVFAAGNTGPEESSINYPAEYPGSIAVGAIDKGKKLLEESSRGPGTRGEQIKPELVAPGVEILSSVPGGYAYASGTSMAAPHVAGAAALLSSQDSSLDAEEVENILTTTADPLTSEKYSESPNYGFGYGLADALEAVESVIPEYTLTISVKGEGKTEPEPNDYIYLKGEEVTITAAPEDGWEFEKWSVNGATKSDKEIALTIDQDITAEAHFVQEEVENDWIILPSPDDEVGLNEDWEVTFNRPFSKDEIDGMVIEEKNSFVPVEIELLKEKGTAVITPVEDYLPGETYSLKIFLSNTNRYKMYFTTEEE